MFSSRLFQAVVVAGFSLAGPALSGCSGHHDEPYQDLAWPGDLGGRDLSAGDAAAHDAGADQAAPPDHASVADLAAHEPPDAFVPDADAWPSTK